MPEINASEKRQGLHLACFRGFPHCRCRNQKEFSRAKAENACESAKVGLAKAYSTLGVADVWATKISAVLTRGEACEIVDLCSGSGGAMPSILRALEAQGYHARATLCDLFPNFNPVAHERAAWFPRPVDATAVPEELNGIRTIFSAFHHFRPELARAILKSAFDAGQPICIFEAGAGAPKGLLPMLGVPFAVLALIPFVRPFRWAYAVFTYLIPVMPLMLLWDGVVSTLRIYSVEQMRSMVSDLERADYVWEIGAIPRTGAPGGMPYLIGRPVAFA
jgi:hypothetical protein